jgi:hypothetical protein
VSAAVKGRCPVWLHRMLLLQAAGATGTFAFTARVEAPGAEQLTVAEGCLSSLVKGPIAVEGFQQMMSLAHRGAQRAAGFSRLSLIRAHEFLVGAPRLSF